MKLGQQAMEALKSQIDGALEIGDDLVVAGVIAIEGTQILIEKEKEKLLEYFSGIPSVHWRSAEYRRCFLSLLRMRSMPDMIWEQAVF